jgi:hypothetical protein
MVAIHRYIHHTPVYGRHTPVHTPYTATIHRYIHRYAESKRPHTSRYKGPTPARGYRARDAWTVTSTRVLHLPAQGVQECTHLPAQGVQGCTHLPAQGVQASTRGARVYTRTAPGALHRYHAWCAPAQSTRLLVAHGAVHTRARAGAHKHTHTCQLHTEKVDPRSTSARSVPDSRPAPPSRAAAAISPDACAWRHVSSGASSAAPRGIDQAEAGPAARDRSVPRQDAKTSTASHGETRSRRGTATHKVTASHGDT